MHFLALFPPLLAAVLTQAPLLSRFDFALSTFETNSSPPSSLAVGLTFLATAMGFLLIGLVIV